MSTRIGGFEATAALGTEALRALIATGAAEERVWAAWRLALDLGRAVPEIVGLVAGEPSAGVRRALLPVIAGHGEVDILVALARHDPAEEVRAAAAQYMGRLGPQGGIPAGATIDRFEAGTPETRRAILDGLPARLPAELWLLVRHALRRGTPDEQLDAFDAALRSDEVAHRSGAMRWLERRHGDVGKRAWLRLGRHAADEIHALLALGGATLRRRAIGELAGVPLAVVLPYLDDADPETFVAMAARADHDAAPLDAMIRGLLARCIGSFLAPVLDRLERLAAATPEVTALAPSLREFATWRANEWQAGRTLREEKLGTKISLGYYYRRIIDQLDRLRV